MVFGGCFWSFADDFRRFWMVLGGFEWFTILVATSYKFRKNCT